MAHSNMRPLIQYDLNEPPTTVPSLPVVPPSHPSNTYQPPTKKRKRNHRNQQKHQPAQPQRTPFQHWDDPGSSAVGVVYSDEQEDSAVPLSGSVQVSAYVDDVEEEEEEYGEEVMEGDVEEEEEESRPLTHEELWDDAALIDAWNSAEAEYEAYHGTSKAWKTEPVKKSPLWYNKPCKPGPSKPNARSNNIPPAPPQEQDDGEPEPDTAPLDFDTYVPTHDPSLVIPSDGTIANPPTMATPFSVPPPSTMMVGRDEAFNNALSAMYWSGYWTAVYHCQSHGKNNDVPAEANKENGVKTDEDEVESEDLVPTQR